MNPRWKPSVTVAAIIERQGRYLLIEEHTPEGVKLNNPAGHMEEGEDPIAACAREALEETAHPFEPEHLVGVYLARFQRPVRGAQAPEDVTYLRFAFCGCLGEALPQRSLDQGIVRILWLSLDEVRASSNRHRSPLVLQCIEDHARGQRFPLLAIHAHPSLRVPIALN
ncbi:MAG: NUDIX hydrolase [Alphaproteobacteria bacterium]|nr:NUDIX hydrolase [Alphaproteobacteria bacterium]